VSTLKTLLTGGGLIALGAVLGAVLSALVANWLGAKRDQRRYEHEQEMAGQAQRHEQAMAADVRRHDELKQAYLELLSYLSHHAEWARSVQPLMGTVAAPDPLPHEDVRRVEVLVTAFGSQEVARLLREWRDRAAELANADLTIRMVEESARPSQQLDDQARDELKAIPSYRDAMVKADEAIREQVRRELAGDA
jgi:hypothetical protein